MSREETPYRILTRSKVAVILVVTALAGALLLWYSLAWIEALFERTMDLVDSSPQQAAAALAAQLRTIGIVNGIVVGSLAVYIGRIGWRSAQSKTFPPRGSWIMDASKIRNGAAAVRMGQIFLVTAAVLLVFALGTAVAAWYVAAEVEQTRGPSDQLESRVLA